MPLSEHGKKLKREFQNRYGKKKGERVFYAKENKDAKFAHAVKGGSHSSPRRMAAKHMAGMKGGVKTY